MFRIVAPASILSPKLVLSRRVREFERSPVPRLRERSHCSAVRNLTDFAQSISSGSLVLSKLGTSRADAVAALGSCISCFLVGLDRSEIIGHAASMLKRATEEEIASYLPFLRLA